MLIIVENIEVGTPIYSATIKGIGFSVSEGGNLHPASQFSLLSGNFSDCDTYAVATTLEVVIN